MCVLSLAYFGFGVWVCEILVTLAEGSINSLLLNDAMHLPYVLSKRG